MMDATTWSFLWGCVSGIGLGAGVMFVLMFDYYELTQRMKRVMWAIIYKERK
jgi:hypothetical protein